MLIQNAIDELQRIAPTHLAEKWDNVGLLLGDPKNALQRIMTCLTITSAVVDEAVQKKVDLIVSHHPILFKPTQRITAQSEEGRMLWQLASHNIAVYSPHTAYDNAQGGINDQLAQSLNLSDIKPLIPISGSSKCKIVVYVPASDLDKVSAALFQSGAGIIGNYQQCSFRISGTGTFLGTGPANPTVGQVGKLEEVNEFRLEVFCPSDQVSSAIQAMRSAHSYEEPAFDVYPLHETAGTDTVKVGSGRIGTLSRPMSPSDLADRVAKSLKTTVVLTGQSQRASIRSLAIVCGAGGSLLQNAMRAGVDAFLTGEIRFHDELAAQAAGITVLAAGHYGTERPGIENLAQMLASALPACKVWASCAEQNPAQWVTFSANLSSG